MSGKPKDGAGRSPPLIVAVPADGQLIADHFAEAPAFAIVTLHCGRVSSVQFEPCRRHPQGGYAQFLANLGVKLVLAAGIGSQVTGRLGAAGIEVRAGISGTIEQAVRDLTQSLALAEDGVV